MKNVKLMVGAGLVALNLVTYNVSAAPKLDVSVSSSAKDVQADPALVAQYTKDLANVSAANLPDKVAQIIANTPKAQRAAVTAAIMKAALTLNPSAAGSIISAIARTSPDVVVVAVRMAVTVAPGQAKNIASALADARKSIAQASPNSNSQKDKAKQIAVTRQLNQIGVATLVLQQMSKEILIVKDDIKKTTYKQP